MIKFSASKAKSQSKIFYKDYLEHEVYSAAELGQIAVDHSISSYLYGSGVTSNGEACEGHKAGESIVGAGTVVLFDFDAKSGREPVKQGELEKLLEGRLAWAGGSKSWAVHNAVKWHVAVTIDRELPLDKDEFVLWHRAVAQYLGFETFNDAAMEGWTQQIAPSCREDVPSLVFEGEPLDMADVMASYVERVDEVRESSGSGNIAGEVEGDTVFTLSDTGEVVGIKEMLARVADGGKVRVHCLAGYEHDGRRDTALVRGGDSGVAYYHCTGGRCGQTLTLHDPAPFEALEDEVVPILIELRREEQRQINSTLQDPVTSVFPSVLSLAQMLRRLVLVADGSSITRIDSPRTNISLADAKNLFAPSLTSNGIRAPKTLSKWLNSPLRLTVEKRTFAPGCDIFCTDPEGASAINIWRKTERKPVDTTGHVGMFIEQVTYLFPDEAEKEKFLDWLAHIEQYPGILPHYGWLHISEQTGTGRNWIASVLCRLWRGMVAPNIDLPSLLESSFNGQLSGRILAMVDEVQEGGNDSYRHAQKLKSLVNAETRLINPKYGRQMLEFNTCRWLVFSNHRNALPINDEDRRWRVVINYGAPRPAEFYERLYGVLDDLEFINAIGYFLAKRDISGFKPGERPPLNSDKATVIASSKSVLRERADDLVREWPTTLISNKQVAQYLSFNKEEALSMAMRRALEDAGGRQLGVNGKARPLRINDKVVKYWVLRDHARWRDADTDLLVTEAKRGQSYFPNCEDGVFASFMPDDSI